MHSTTAPVRILIAAYGPEPPDWARRALAAAGPDRGLVVRLLVVRDVPRPRFTSLTPWARWRLDDALAAWRHRENERARTLAEELQALLAGRVDVAHETPDRADPAGTIAGHAAAWGADVAVIAQDTAPAFRRAVLGAVDARVVRYAPCPVVVVPAAEGPGRRQSVSLGRLASAGIEGRR
jgi:nucleotide-binding universal stress UspA family protein